jgi:hypothetical protein
MGLDKAFRHSLNAKIVVGTYPHCGGNVVFQGSMSSGPMIALARVQHQHATLASPSHPEAN